jgi:4-amino-4-deoxy-L-arabinose transferase-like glycosyltransferase
MGSSSDSGPEYCAEVDLSGHMTTRQHTVIAAILLITGAYMIRMSAVEVQPSPEGFIAQAGSAVRDHGPLFDLAPVSSGGLTTGLIPPAVPTMIAAAMRASGPSQGALRWYSIVCIALSMWLIYLLGSRFLSHQGAQQAMVVSGISMPWLLYGRQASIEIAAIPLILAGVLMLMMLGDHATNGRRFLAAGAYVLVCAAAGLTSVSASILLFVLALGYSLITRRLMVVVTAVFGLAASLPWLLMMFSTYGDQVLLASSIDVPVSELTYLSTGPLDALLLLVGSSPVLVLALVWCISVVIRRELLPTEHESSQRLLALWFVVSIVTVLVQQQRSYHSLVFAVPAASVLSVYALERFRRLDTPKLLLAALTAVSAATLGALATYTVRATSLGRLVGVAAMIAFAIVVLTNWFRHGRFSRPLQLAAGLYKPVYYGAIAVTAVVGFLTVLMGSPYLVQGARTVAYELNDRPTIDGSFTYVYHNHTTDGMNAQLDWYTNGWMTGQMLGRTHQSLPMPTGSIDGSALHLIEGVERIVYYHPGRDRMHLNAMRQALEQNYAEVVSTKDYTLFAIR